MTNEKDIHGASLAADVTAGSIATDAATARHTKGPWRARVTGCDTPSGSALGTITYIESGDVEIAVMYDDTDQRANAQLIAAAPELLEAVRVLVEVLMHPPDGLAYENAFVVAGKAIHKAEGRSYP